MKPKAIFINELNLFKWRIELGNEHSEWTSSYSSLLVHKFKNGETWALATDYWNGTLPIEIPFQIIEQ